MIAIPAFWTNTIWYLLLGITTVVEIIILIAKAGNRKQAIAFFITVLGITLNFETIILIFFNSYEYYPMLLRHTSNPFDDSLAGNLFSQFSVAATLTLAIVLKWKRRWFFVCAVGYGLIEELFLALGIYRHNWYQTWMTVLFLPPAFWLVKTMYRLLLSGLKPWLYYIYIQLGLFSLTVITLFWGFSIACLQIGNDKLLPDPIISRYLITVVFYSLISVLMMVVYFAKSKAIWRWLSLAVQSGLYYLAYHFEFFLFPGGHFLAVAFTMLASMYLAILLLDWLYGQPYKKYAS